MKNTYLLLAALTVFVAGETFAAPHGQSGRASTVAAVGGAVRPAGRLATLPMPRNVPTSAVKYDNVAESVDTETESQEVDMREKEKTACQSNNVGVGNTFVWASRNSNIESYSSMIEDTEAPENNVCFVRVEIKSNDSRINVSDMNGKYFEMGQVVTCGGWLDESKLQSRILDAKKTARTWATIGGAVGGAGIGVGIMEIGGNKLLANAGVDSVQGQKALSDNDLVASQLKAWKNASDKDDRDKYTQVHDALQTIKDECAKLSDQERAGKDNCKKYDLNRLLQI